MLQLTPRGQKLQEQGRLNPSNPHQLAPGC